MRDISIDHANSRAGINTGVVEAKETTTPLSPSILIMPATLPTRRIGTTDVTAIGWGAMGLSLGYGTVPSDEERLKVGCFDDHGVLVILIHCGLQLIDSVYESGCLNWDTADVYGDSEELLGKW